MFGYFINEFGGIDGVHARDITSALPSERDHDHTISTR